MKAKDIMTAPVVTAAPDTRLAQVAALLAEHRISGLPVVHHGRVAGVVSEHDLLRHRDVGPEGRRARPWWACMPRSPSIDATFAIARSTFFSGSTDALGDSRSRSAASATSRSLDCGAGDAEPGAGSIALAIAASSGSGFITMPGPPP